MRFLIFSLIFCIVDSKNDVPPKWSSTYSINGVIFIPYAEIEEPFVAFFDGPAQKSRIDYYGGMDKTIQLGTEGAFGKSFKLSPYSNEIVQNAEGCFLVEGTRDSAISAQTVLPDISDFNYIGSEFENGKNCEKWEKVEKVFSKENRYTILLKRYEDTAVPVKYEMRGYNSLLGSHYDHYYLTYDQFSGSKPDPSIFEIYKKDNCTGFPGPGIDHTYTMNPMKEFVDNDHYHVNATFERFKEIHGRSYEDELEEDWRKDVYRQNMRFIHSHNRRRDSYVMASNHLTDRTDHEMKRLRGKLYTPGYNGGNSFHYTEAELYEAPSSLDWRLYGAVSPVKDQSVCGSCWSFGTVGTLEGAQFLKTGKMIRLSQQALVDCSWGFGNNGCDGGEDFRAYKWIMKHGGIPSELDYGGYLGADGYCHSDDVRPTFGIKGFVNVTSGDLDALKVAVARNGPISVAIDASHKSLSFYSYGVYYEPKCNNTPDGLDHAVLAVGYGTLQGKKYWLIKNSWSTYWGNDGYVLMSQENNNCGVATTPTYVIPK